MLSIITVVFNGAPLLEGTLRSVSEQTYPHVEHLVVDGGSTDGTLDIIRRRAAHPSPLTPHPSSLAPHSFRWLSEPDQGLYDAMNKGLRMASGDFVWFLNAGDQLFEKDTVEKLMRLAAPDTDVLYGEVMLVDSERLHLGTRSALTTQKLPESLDWKSLRLGMVVCHQAFVARRSLAPPYVEGNLAADIGWVISVLKKSRKVVHSRLVLAEYLVGGISKKRRRRSLLDRYAVLKKHYGWLPNLWNHLLILARAVFARRKK